MKESLSRHAGEIFDRLSAGQQRIARVVFQQLSDRDAEGREIRRPAPVSHIAAVAGVTVQAVEEVVRGFAAPEAAFLYRNEDGDLDITHESLIRNWRLIQGTKLQGSAETKGWMQEEVEARDEFLLLVERARKRDTLMGSALEDALRWRALGLNADWARRYTKTTGADTTLEDVRMFVEECRKQEVSGPRRLRNGFRRWTGGSGGFPPGDRTRVMAIRWPAEESRAESVARVARRSTQEANRRGLSGAKAESR